MPYVVKRDDRCPVSRPWGVSNEKTGKLHGCHPSKDAGREQQKALYANEPGARPQRSVQPEPVDDVFPQPEGLAGDLWP